MAVYRSLLQKLGYRTAKNWLKNIRYSKGKEIVADGKVGID